MQNYSVEVAVARVSMNLSNLDGAPIAATMNTDSVVTFADYLTSSIEYFSSMAKFDGDVQYVSMLVRAHMDTNMITITRNPDGTVRVNH